MAKSSPLSIAELQSLVPRLAATAKMLGELAGHYRGSGPSKKTGTGGRGRRRGGVSSAAVQDKIISALKSGKGLQLKDIVKRSGLDVGAVQYHLRALRANKKARVVGERKSARWFAAR